jgi:hypothetical protein
MVAIYVRWIREGRMTLEDVPARWREEVRAALAEG